MAGIDLPATAALAMARRIEARERLYRTFRTYRLSEYGTTDSACPHCVTGDQFAWLAATPIAQLRLDQAWCYASAVWQSRSDFKYFLPRLLELVEPMDELIHWDIIERKLPQERWLVCSEPERHAVASYITAVDECARATAASDSNDVAELLKPLMVPVQIASGLPLAESMSKELAAYRARVFSEHIEQCRDGSSTPAIAVLARALNKFVDGKQKRELKARLRSVIPSDDVLLSWIQTSEPEQLLDAALAKGLADDAALDVGTAFSSVALLTSAR